MIFIYLYFYFKLKIYINHIFYPFIKLSNSTYAASGFQNGTSCPAPRTLTNLN